MFTNGASNVKGDSRMLPMRVLFVKALVSGWLDPKFLFEILRKILGIIIPDLIGDLGDRQLAFGQEVGGPFEADVPDEVQGGLPGQG